MERTYKEDGYNIVVIQCDGCGEEISQVRHGGPGWFKVTIDPLARDDWNAGDEIGTYHFCSTDCFRTGVESLDPSGVLRERIEESD